MVPLDHVPGFWSSDKLTGSQTYYGGSVRYYEFWSSDKLTASQTNTKEPAMHMSFGAVTN